MAEIIKTLNAMSTEEKLQVMEFLCSALSSHYTQETPAWHAEVLAERENASEDEFEDWEDIKGTTRRLRASSRIRSTIRLRAKS